MVSASATVELISLGAASQAVLKVGDGRGFVIEVNQRRYVITAAHCLPDLPLAHAASDRSEHTHRSLLGPLGGPCPVWAECVFADPVADLAVLATPDGQELWDEAEAYNVLVGAETVTPFPLGRLRFRRQRHRLSKDTVILGDPKATSEALMLSLDGEWFSCRIYSYGRSLVITDPAQPICPGMSGSPVILPDGSAVGVVCISAEGAHDHGPNPALFASLPAWLLRHRNLPTCPSH